MTGGVAQDVDPEFKSQYYKKQNKKKLWTLAAKFKIKAPMAELVCGEPLPQDGRVLAR
jgi:hypothetical protein